MVEMIGADVAALRALGRTLTTGGQRIGAARTQLTGELGRVGWRGRDAEAFRSAWKSSLSGLLADASRQLSEAGEEVHRQADEQARASDKGGSPSGSGMTGGILTPGLITPGLGLLTLLGRGGEGRTFRRVPTLRMRRHHRTDTRSGRRGRPTSSGTRTTSTRRSRPPRAIAGSTPSGGSRARPRSS